MRVPRLTEVFLIKEIDDLDLGAGISTLHAFRERCRYLMDQLDKEFKDGRQRYVQQLKRASDRFFITGDMGDCDMSLYTLGLLKLNDARSEVVRNIKGIKAIAKEIQGKEPGWDEKIKVDVFLLTIIKDLGKILEERKADWERLFPGEQLKSWEQENAEYMRWIQDAADRSQKEIEAASGGPSNPANDELRKKFDDLVKLLNQVKAAHGYKN